MCLTSLVHICRHVGAPSHLGNPGGRGSSAHRCHRNLPFSRDPWPAWDSRPPGRDGRDGEKGEKGEPGIPVARGLVPQKGEKGEQGAQGPPGKAGRTGNKGSPGPPGVMGVPGDKGSGGVYKTEQQSAFSVTRRTMAKPSPNAPIVFSHAITNLNGHFNIKTGKFLCRIPGSYYFVYHASSDDSLCMSLMRDGDIMASFCDHLNANTYQVSSGGVAIYLKKNQEVWLETNDYNGIIGVEGKQSVFSGFLLYPH
ncbi:hypothetical protein AGOR_G00030780 [Albula goreensis]|uniref:C1q domain-containing protein n=1 Tax=Albula goreensis TaxID=1534307 RepID=A0A8T3E700_9TELE|nr:hypothetical protein AGOR_G00030780 [Albula goreensis]